MMLGRTEKYLAKFLMRLLRSGFKLEDEILDESSENSASYEHIESTITIYMNVAVNLLQDSYAYQFQARIGHLFDDYR